MQGWQTSGLYCIVLLFTESMLAHAACFTTPERAIEAELSGVLRRSDLDENGYRLIRIQSDPLLLQRWAKIGNCKHPDWPSTSFPVPSASSGTTFLGDVRQSEPSKKPLVVRAGDTVRVWHRDEWVQVEFNGISVGNGSVGDEITVRTSSGSSETGAAFHQRTGVVRGPADVELQP